MEYYSNKNVILYNGKMQEVLPKFIKDNSIDSIVTDPPYELNFMNKGWDNSGVAFQKETWEHCFRILKEGGYLLAFGGSRTYHRIACAIEDAGFEIRDTIMWLYGSGFPKSMNIGLAIDKKEGLQSQRGVGGFNVSGLQEQQNRKAKLHIGSTTDGSKQPAYTDYKSDLAKKWAGWGTCLKPAYEPIIVARKPFKGSLVDNVIANGVGGLNIDECRVAFNGDKWNAQKSGKSSRAFQSEETTTAGGECVANDLGRFPANVILTYDENDFDEVCGGFPSEKGNSASRYFYCAKASKKDRDEGLDEFEEKFPASAEFRPNHMEKALKGEDGNPYGRWKPRQNIHPTVKPTDLMQYLVRLVTPANGVILDPFMGSGSTGKAVMYENNEKNKNYSFIGVEMTKEYLPITKARIYYAQYGKVLDKQEKKQEQQQQLTLFDFIGE